MRLGQTHGEERLEAACRRAKRLGAESYGTVKNILRSGLDRHELSPSGPAPSLLPDHENIRGAACYDAFSRLSEENLGRSAEPAPRSLIFRELAA
jgi:hypothetical protein